MRNSLRWIGAMTSICGCTVVDGMMWWRSCKGRLNRWSFGGGDVDISRFSRMSRSRIFEF